MPRYVIERNTGSLTAEEIEAVARKSIEVVESLPGVTWIHSYVSAAEGKVYCLYDAPSPEAIREHGCLTGIPVDAISEVSQVIEPAMFS